MNITSTFGRGPWLGWQWDWVYSHCSDPGTYPDLTFDNWQGCSVRIDDQCYYHSAGGPDLVLTNPVPTVDATFDTCLECSDSKINELWKRCDNDADLAVLSPGHTDVDYAWLCPAGTRVKAYNAGLTAAVAADPAVLKQCGPTPTSCSDLVGWPASDDFGGAGCNSGTVGDTDWDIRWTNDQDNADTFTPSIVALKFRHSVQDAALGQSFTYIDLSQAGEFEIKGQWTLVSDSGGTNDNRAGIELDIGSARNVRGLWNRTQPPSGNAGFSGRAGGSTSYSDSVLTSAEVKITRDAANLVKVYMGGSLIHSGTNSGTLTRIRITGQADSGTTISDWVSISVTDKADGTGNDIYIDPTGDSC